MSHVLNSPHIFKQLSILNLVNVCQLFSNFFYLYLEAQIHLLTNVYLVLTMCQALIQAPVMQQQNQTANFFFHGQTYYRVLEKMLEGVCLFVNLPTYFYLLVFCFVLFFLMVLENEPKVMYIRDKCSATELDPSTYITVCPSLIINCYQL